MALEYVEGGSLESFGRNEPQPEQLAARMVEQIAGAMEKAHAIGLLSRQCSTLTGDDVYIMRFFDFARTFISNDG